MKYIIAIIVVAVFVFIYVIGYKLNSKIKIDCDKVDCEGCKFSECIHNKKEE